MHSFSAKVKVLSLIRKGGKYAKICMNSKSSNHEIAKKEIAQTAKVRAKLHNKSLVKEEEILTYRIQ